MIKANKGIIQIEGTLPAVCAEFSGLIKAIYEMLLENGVEDDFARETIAHAGRLAFMSDEEVDEALEEKKKELEELIKQYEQE